jgi:hypothetical protein
MEAFRSAIKSMGKLVMAADCWSDPAPLKRAWCVLELHAVACEVLAGNGCFELALTQTERSSFISMLKSGGPEGVVESKGDMYYQMLGRIRSQAAECSRVEDRLTIHQHIADTIGFEKLDRLIFTVVERWMEKQMQLELDSSALCGNIRDAETMRRAHAEFLAEQGDFSEAIAFGEENVKTLQTKFPPTTEFNMKVVGRAMLNLSIHYCRSGINVQRCLELRLKVLEMWKSFLPPVHRDLADVMSCVGSSYVAAFVTFVISAA